MDPAGFDNPHEALVDAREAARILGVKVATLYSYASRHRVRSFPSGLHREKRYLLDDLERLRHRADARLGHEAVAAGALRWGEPVLSSALTEIRPDGPWYRGHPVLELARTARFEAVAELLWTGTLPATPPTWTRPRALPAGAPARDGQPHRRAARRALRAAPGPAPDARGERLERSCSGPGPRSPQPGCRRPPHRAGPCRAGLDAGRPRGRRVRTAARGCPLRPARRRRRPARARGARARGPAARGRAGAPAPTTSSTSPPSPRASRPRPGPTSRPVSSPRWPPSVVRGTARRACVCRRW